MKQTLFKELKAELKGDILPYWPAHAKDAATGGFFGSLSNTNEPDPQEWRGIVMVSRFLWTYSAAAQFLDEKKHLDMADYAYSYMMHHFYDPLYGGMYWSVNADGSPLLRRKQIYGNAFAIYALSEYAAAIKKLRGQEQEAARVMNHALDLFQLLEQYAHDKKNGGYWEALNEDWTPTKQTKLSPKDIDCDKSMNTNLHVMEAYTNLYRRLPAACAKYKKGVHQQIHTALKDLVLIHQNKILNKKDFHLDLYFTATWKRMGQDEVSYGHDIEASWLLWEAATELGRPHLQKRLRPVVLQIAATALEQGLDKKTGGFENCRHPSGSIDRTRIWWNQAEALNGFYNAWELTGDPAYEEAVEKVWEWIKRYQRDAKNGEWYWSVNAEGKPDLTEAKGGNWKTSYHNARCCLELLQRHAAQ